MFDESEYEDSLRRAFCRTKPPEYIYVDSRRQAFQIHAIDYGITKGWLVGKMVEVDEQYSRFEARLTEEGRKHFQLDLS